ncbi:putative transposase [Haloferula luteola]|uniref:Putative transposase n=1 Tax=Haloferula luteola TaxID=595692 RepID=A0A840VN43_9BACT|nr:IS3 family transposase [Haloferula luteola]MBB5354031.1 putative transposase [Haloferula luteola]
MNKVRNTLLASGKQVPVTKLCKWLGLAHSSAYYQARQRRERSIDEAMAARIKQIHRKEPACGVRGTWSRLRFIDGVEVNRKKVHRIMRLKGWTLPKRRSGRRPRVKGSTSVADQPDQRWATDLAMIHCGRDGWCVFVPVIDCCTREVLGYALELTGRSKTAERALEEALLARFGTLRSAPKGMLLRHDNGLVFGSRQYRAVVTDYGLTQEYITPYTPQQNGLCERFIKTFKEEFAWVRNYQSIEHARFALRAWIQHYNHRRPHQALKYKSPTQYHQAQCNTAA